MCGLVHRFCRAKKGRGDLRLLHPDRLLPGGHRRLPQGEDRHARAPDRVREGGPDQRERSAKIKLKIKKTCFEN